MSGVQIAKEAIRKNYTKIIDGLANPDEVVEYLFSEVDPPLLTETMKDEILAEQTTSAKIRKMLDKLTRRGERVPQCMYQAFMETENEELANCMVEYIAMLNREKNKTSPSKWPPDIMEINQMLATKIHKLKPRDPVIQGFFNKPDMAYTMNGKRRGIFLLINIVHYENGKDKPYLSSREGSNVDAKNLRDVFTELHFDVEERLNLTSEEILSEAAEVAKKVEDTDSCLAVAIFSHGGTDGIYGQDNIPVKFEKIKEKFHPVECPALNEKPKIFFIQACRGTQSEQAGAGGQSGADAQNKGDNVDASVDASVEQICDDIGELTIADVNEESKATVRGTINVSSDADFLIAHSTPAGAISWRHMKFGSWFILALVWVFRFHAHELSLGDMLQKVNNYVSQGRNDKNMVTVSSYTSSLRHPLYFFPGIYASHGHPREHPDSLK